MSAFDVAVGVTAQTMNEASSAVYTKIYPGIFKSSKVINGTTVTWDVQEAPTFDLSNVSDLHDQIGAHLRKHKVQGLGDIGLDEVHNTLTELLKPSSFKLIFPKISLTDGGSPIVAGLTFSCTITTEDAVLKLEARSAKFTTNAPPWDKLVLEGIINEMMAIANTYLSGVNIPIISFQGVSLTSPTVSVQQNRVIALFNLGGKPQPSNMQINYPDDPFFLLLSDEAKTAIGQAETRGLVKTMSKSGSVGSSLGGASYHANATLSDISVTSAGPGSTQFNFVCKCQGGVGAKVKFLCVPVGVSYNLYAKPNPSGTISILMQGDKVIARTESVSSFVIVISPSGSIIEKVISAITDPILQAVTAVFSPIISEFLGGIEFELTTLPTFSVNIEGVSVNLTPSNMQTGSFDGYMMAQGQLTIS